MSENDEPKKPTDHWFWRRLMAFMSFVAMIYYTLFLLRADPAVLTAYVFLTAQWALPSAVETLAKIYKGN